MSPPLHWFHVEFNTFGTWLPGTLAAFVITIIASTPRATTATRRRPTNIKPSTSLFNPRFTKTPYVWIARSA